MKPVLCFDIGGTFVKYGLVDETGRILTKGRFATNRGNGQAVLEEIDRIIESCDARGVSFSCPGFADDETGEIAAGNVIAGFNGLNLRERIGGRHGLPVAVENDANCAALAEYVFGAGQGSRGLAVMTLGTGVGGGLVLNGKLWKGNRSMAGEFGFLFVHGIHTDCPEEEILSAHGSVRALTEAVNRELGTDLDGREIFDRAAAQDPICRKHIAHFLDSVAMGVYNVAYTLAPDTILIGGAISSREDLLPEIRQRVSALTPSFSLDLNETTKIDRCRFGNDAGLMGACASFLQSDFR